MNVLSNNNILYLELFKSDKSLILEPTGDPFKHTPTIKHYNNIITINLTESSHPMNDDHYIDFIILESKKGFQIKYLNKDEFEASFTLLDDVLENVYLYCNLHGLWKIDVK